MTQITIDLREFDSLGRVWDATRQQLSGIVDDIRRRLLTIDFLRLDTHNIDASGWLAEMDHVTSRLTDDIIRLEQGATELLRQMWLAGDAQPGALGPFAAALPDLWWFKGRAAEDGAGSPPPPILPPTPPTAGGIAAGQQIVATAQQWVGIPYQWGGGHGAVVAPRAVNVDCSGLVHEVFGENGVKIGGTAQDMYASGAPVADLAHALPGDLLFWGSSQNIHHVAIYVGDGKMIEAPHTGAWVHVTNVYSRGFVGIRRVLPA